jgi:hypothetical protein
VREGREDRIGLGMEFLTGGGVVDGRLKEGSRWEEAYLGGKERTEKGKG